MEWLNWIIWYLIIGILLGEGLLANDRRKKKRHDGGEYMIAALLGPLVIPVVLLRKLLGKGPKMRLSDAASVRPQGQLYKGRATGAMAGRQGHSASAQRGSAMSKKPMLASDWSANKVKFPVYVQPKIDGVRAINFTGRLVGRSLKTHRNIYTTNKFSLPQYAGLDGEMAVAEPTHPSLCRMTSGAISTIQGSPEMTWWVFDLISSLPYNERYELLKQKVLELDDPFIRVIPNYLVNNMEELVAYDEEFLSLGYEGTIIRDPEGAYKEGRSTPKEGGLLRIKRFLDFEFRILSITEGLHNDNEAGVNELGNTQRSSHQENMIPNGLLGSIQGEVLGDVKDRGRVVLKKGDEVTIGPGKMSHSNRARYFENQHEFVGKIGKGKFFPKGIKDKPRFPTFLSLREGADIPPREEETTSSQGELF